MGRPKGFKMSDEQIAAMKAGRQKAKAERIASGEASPVKEKSTEKKRILTPEHLAKIAEGRRFARERKLANGEPLRVVTKKRVKKGQIEVDKDGKPTLYVTGKEKNAFDFYTPIRDIFRALNKHNEVEKILRKITDKQYWENITWVQNALGEFVVLKAKE
jgi:hypothetical protein